MTTRTFLRTYTPRNIAAELVYRWAQWRRRRARAAPSPGPARDYDDHHARQVGRFYDTHHHSFLKVYGEVIQAFRTREVSQLLDYEADAMGLRAGQRVLDAGCGVGAPAIYFARQRGVQVDAITISSEQAAAARRAVAEAGLEDRVRVVLGDYHRLDDYLPADAYDVVYFLESFGHSRAKGRAVDAGWKALKPGGALYIKDLFTRVPLQPEQAGPIAHEIQRINEAYHYEVGNLNTLLDLIRARGFILASLKSVDLPLDGFEDLAISNAFQELTGIARIDNWEEYVFPVDFFELWCVKPPLDLTARLDRHVTQNLCHLRETRPPGPGHTKA